MKRKQFSVSYGKTINNYLENNDVFVFPFIIKEKNKKHRTIITYKNDEGGFQLRAIHSFLNKFLPTIYKTSKHSYAYKKGVSCYDAIKTHLKSNLFIKLDIESFFESITEEKFFSLCNDIIVNYYEPEKLKQSLKTAFYKNHLSLGYVTSPIISDMFLSKFDAEIELFLKNRKNISYSRYCDDILISSKSQNWTELEEVFYEIKNRLKEYSLEINERKTKKQEIKSNNNSAVTYLGLNISKNEDGTNKITISKTFVLKTINLLEKYYNGEKTEYLRSTILSRISYIIKNSASSYNRFLKKHVNRFNKEYTKI